MTKHTKLPVRPGLISLFEKAIKHWKSDKIITAPQAKHCQESLEPMLFDWRRFSNVVFWFASTALVLAVLQIIVQINLSANALFVTYGVLAFFSFASGHFFDQAEHRRPYASGSLYILGSLLTLTAIGNLTLSHQLLITSIICGIVGLMLRSGLTWALAVWMLGLWVCQIDINTRNVTLDLSLQDPRKVSLLFGIFAVFISVGIKNIQQLGNVYKGSLIASYLIAFKSLWLLSLPLTGLTVEPLLWSIVLAVVSLLAVACGVKNKYPITLRFGLFFFLLNFYSVCNNYLINEVAPVIFFLVIALSLWIIGKIALMIEDHNEKWHHEK